MTELTPKQYTAIEIQLATAPDIQDDLKEELGYEKNIFFNLDLFEYRINNNRLDIAEDLDVKSRYGIEKNKNLEPLISMAFRGHHNEDFFPEYRFDGLFGKVTNDMIKDIRYELNGRENGYIGGRYGRTPEEHSEHSRKGGRIGGRIGGRNRMALLSEEERSELGLIGALASAEAQGKHVWSLEEIVDIHNFREESIGKGRYKTSPCWDDTTAEMNEKYGENWSTSKIKDAYRYNKDKLSDEEE